MVLEMGRYYYSYFLPSRPIPVENGIKLKSNRGQIGDTWWSQRWVSLLESFGWSNRLQRGKNYARRGQVIEFNIEKGQVSARVQGSVSTPYKVTIKLKVFSDEQWEKIFDELASKAVFLAFLLSGEMPHDIESLYINLGLSLFPETSKDINTHCTCPDVANPCKHIAAVHYILADTFDENPFFIFKLRGRDKNEVLKILRKRRTRLTKSRKPSKKKKLKKSKKKPSSFEFKNQDDFWGSNKAFSNIYIEISPPQVPEPTLKLTGPLPGPKFKIYNSILKKYYRNISNMAIKYAYKD